jgi:hypothetical protein
MGSDPKAASIGRERAILATIAGVTANVDWLTSDRIEALTGGHGMLNLPVIAIADALAVELLRGADLNVKFANVARQPIDDLLAKAIDAARSAGADAANAALLSATLLYLAGAQAQVGIPAGNRKLGASARMIAGVDRWVNCSLRATRSSMSRCLRRWQQCWACILRPRRPRLPSARPTSRRGSRARRHAPRVPQCWPAI